MGVGTEAGDEVGGDEGGDEDGLPEGEEEDSFDAEEFRYGSVFYLVNKLGKKKKEEDRWEDEDGPERFEIVIDDDPEHGQAIQCQTDASIVDDTNIQIPRVGTKVTFVELSDRFQYHGRYRQRRFDLDVFFSVIEFNKKKKGMEERKLTEDAAFEEEKGIWIADVHLAFEQVDREDGFLWWSSVKKDE